MFINKNCFEKLEIIFAKLSLTTQVHWKKSIKIIKLNNCITKLIYHLVFDQKILIQNLQVVKQMPSFFLLLTKVHESVNLKKHFVFLNYKKGKKCIQI